MELGGAILDESGGLLLDRRGQAIPLRAQSMKVLRLLAARAGEVVGKDDLMAEVWGDVHVTDDSLTQCVADIRRAIGDEGHRVLQTVPKRGYWLVPTGVPAEAPTAIAARRRRPWIGVAAALLLALAGLAFWATRPAGPAGLPSIAVLPFEDLSGDPRWERLGRGIAADLAPDLARGKGITVTAADATLTAPGNSEEVGRDLGVRYVLDGTLQAEGGVLRVAARLVEAEGGEIVWSDRWERPAEDIFAVQDEILAGIGGRLEGTWTGLLARTARAEVGERPTRNLDAYELYLLGAEAKHRFTPEGYAQAADLLRRAVAADPGYTKAYVTLSITLMFQFPLAPSAEGAMALLDEAKGAIERAVALDPEDPDVLMQLASVRVTEGRHDEAWDALLRAMELAPNNPDLLATAAWSYPFADRGPAPLDRARRAIEINPGHPDWYYIPLAVAAAFAGDHALAREAALKAPPVPDSLIALGVAEAHLGDVEASREAFAAFTDQTTFERFGRNYGTADIAVDPLWAPIAEGAKLAGVPLGPL